MKLTLTGYSTALFSTWFFIEELGLLFDAGDGLSSGLLQKAGKVRHAFLSHADRDHLTGLLQFVQLNTNKDKLNIHYPKHCGSFEALANFSKQFDPHVQPPTWNPIQAHNEIEIKKNIWVKAIRNNHVEAPSGITKSLSFQVYQQKRKLKPSFLDLSQTALNKIIEEHGRVHVTESITVPLIAYSGDSPVENYDRWDGTNILIHEATFLNTKEDEHVVAHGNQHSTLEEVIKMVSEIKVEQLVLSHFSSRYSADFIDEQIRKLCKKYNIQIPVFRVLPGQLARNILSKPPINT